jgi:hypothetical protein
MLGKYFSSVNQEEILRMALLPGFHVGEVYDNLTISYVSEELKILQFENEGIIQFQMFIERQDDGGYVVQKRPGEFFMLQENGDVLLQENGDKLKVSGLIPV